MDGTEHDDDSSSFADNEGYQALPAELDEENSENEEPILENSGYQSVEDASNVDDSTPIDPMLSRLVDRQMQRLEEDYRATTQAVWSMPTDSRIDRYLDRLEARITKIEDVFEELSSGQEIQQTDAGRQNPQQAKRPPLQVEEIKKQANSIQMGTLPVFMQNAELTIEEMMARLQVGLKDDRQ